MQFEFVRGLWTLNNNWAEWSEQEKELDVNFRCAGQSNYLSNELCRKNEEARRQGYRRYHIGQNIYGYALYGNASDGRMSENVATPEEAVKLAMEFESRKPGFHFVDLGHELTEGMKAAEAFGAVFTNLAAKEAAPAPLPDWARGIAALALIVSLLYGFAFWRSMWALASWAPLIIPAWLFLSFWVIVRFAAGQRKDEAD